jgi:hypothetical protein
VRALACLALVMALAGCATSVPKIVKVRVAVTCIDDSVGPEPAGLETKESLRAEPDPAKRYTRLAADWARRAARMEVTEPALVGCRTPPPAPPTASPPAA